MRCVIISEIPVAYRTGWFRHIRQHSSIDLHVVYLAEGQPDRPWEQSDHLLADWVSLSNSWSLGGTRSGFFPRVNLDVSSRLDHLDPDVVLVPGWAHPSCWQTAWWCRRRKVPFGVLCESWKPQRETRLPTAVTSAIRDRVLRSAAMALPVGQRAADYLGTVGVQSIHVVHANTCDSISISEATADVDPFERPTALFVGRLMAHKGAGLLPAIGDQLALVGVDLAIAGDGPLRSAIEQDTVANGAVHHLGPLAPESAHKTMAKASVVLVPSSKEPWGVVLHEALAAGTPVVASSEVGSAEDLIAGVETGRIVRADATSVVGAVEDLLARAPAREECTSAAARISYQTAAEEFYRAVDQMLEVG